MIETNRIEFKRELTRELDIEREVVAFLNYREGGMIYIGIADDGAPIGVKDIDGDMLRLKDRIRIGISPSPMGLFDVTVERIEGTPVIKIFVASGSEKPYYKTKYGLSEKGCFIRVGTAAEPMTTTQIEDLYAHRVRNSLRNIPSPRKNLTFRQLHIYYESKGLALNEHLMENLYLLTDNYEPNYVAFLLADENNVSIKVAKYAGTDRDLLIVNNELGFCSLLKATDNVLDKLRVENNVSSEITYKRRIGMTEKEFFGGISSPRNKELMRVFRDVDMVEALGSGMLRIGKEYTLKRIFSFTPNFIRTTIKFHSQKKSSLSNIDQAFGSVNDDFGNVNSSANSAQPTQRQLNILSVIKQATAQVGNVNGSVNGEVSNVKQGITTKEILSKFNLSERTLYRELSALKQLHLIQRIGSDKTGYWIAE